MSPEESQDLPCKNCHSGIFGLALMLHALVDSVQQLLDWQQALAKSRCNDAADLHPGNWSWMHSLVNFQALRHKLMSSPAETLIDLGP